MPLTIQIVITPIGDPIPATPAALQTLADEHGDVGPGGGTPVAITIPKITSDQTGLNYETRNGNTEFRFKTGTLKLTLRQEVHVSTALSPCARTVWLQHEQKHVLDNERLMSRMDPDLRANMEFARILIHPTSRFLTPRSSPSKRSSARCSPSSRGTPRRIKIRAQNTKASNAKSGFVAATLSENCSSAAATGRASTWCKSR